MIAASRRAVLACGVAAGAGLLLPRPAAATPKAMTAAMDAFTRGRIALPGKVSLDIPPLVENGNSVPVKMTLAGAPTAGVTVKTFALFSEKNPESVIGRFHLGPRAGRPEVSTRIRLADSQRLIAIAELSDGAFWSGEAELVVTLPACAET